MKRIMHIFVEGATDKAFVRKLADRAVVSDGYITECGGKNQMAAVIRENLESDLMDPPGFERVSVFILRDLDAKETVEGIVQCFRDIFREMLRKGRTRMPAVTFAPLDGHPNVYVFRHDTLNLVVALHIAEHKLAGWNFANAETEDYLLAAGLEDDVLQRFSRDCGIDATRLKTKVLHEIPDILRSNGFEPQQKDLLAAFLVACRFIQVTHSDDVQRFVKVLMDRIEQFRDGRPWRHFDSILAALEYLQA